MEFILVLVFAVASVLGYIVIKKVPSLLHTPLMSGMNALSGVTILGALIAIVTANSAFGTLIAAVAVILAAVNLVGGFAITHKMLCMFDRKNPTKVFLQTNVFKTNVRVLYSL